MSIVSAEYSDDENMVIKTVANGKTVFVPKVDTNRHYQAIQKWVSGGGTIT